MKGSVPAREVKVSAGLVGQERTVDIVTPGKDVNLIVWVLGAEYVICGKDRQVQWMQGTTGD